MRGRGFWGYRSVIYARARVSQLRCASELLLCLQNSLDVTETFKQQKSKLVQEAFNPCVIQDPLYFLQAPQEDFIPLTASLYHSIVSGEILL